MELMHPLALVIGIPVLILATILLHVIPAFSKKEYMGGIRTGAAPLVKNLPIYKKIVLRRKIISVINKIFVITAIIAALVLVARPYKVQSTKIGVQKRDIFLCLDVSYSLYELNYELVDYLKQVVTELKGDRFGITIFNTSSVVYVPMTDDYDYVVMRLDELEEYFNLQKEYYSYYDEEGMMYFSDYTDEEMDRYWEIEDRLHYIEAGTLVNNDTRGSSLIGEGLASCLYSFPSIGDSNRTRVIIFATDNADSSRILEMPQLPEAAKLCKKNDVTVFSIFPREEAYYLLEYTKEDFVGFQKELKDAVELTGGELYVQSKDDTVSSIVEQIRSHEAMAVDDIVTEQIIDLPVPAIIVLILSLAGTTICVAFLKGK